MIHSKNHFSLPCQMYAASDQMSSVKETLNLNSYQTCFDKNDFATILKSRDLFWAAFCKTSAAFPEKQWDSFKISLESNKVNVEAHPTSMTRMKEGVESIRKIYEQALNSNSDFSLWFLQLREPFFSMFIENSHTKLQECLENFSTNVSIKLYKSILPLLSESCGLACRKVTESREIYGESVPLKIMQMQCKPDVHMIEGKSPLRLVDRYRFISPENRDRFVNETLDLNTYQNYLNKNDFATILKSKDLFWAAFCKTAAAFPEKQWNSFKISLESNRVNVVAHPLSMTPMKERVETIRKIYEHAFYAHSEFSLWFQKADKNFSTLFTEDPHNGRLNYRQFSLEQSTNLFASIIPLFSESCGLICREVTEDRLINGELIPLKIMQMQWKSKVYMDPHLVDCDRDRYTPQENRNRSVNRTLNKTSTILV